MAFSPIPVKFVGRGVICDGKTTLLPTSVPVGYIDVGPDFQEALKATRDKKDVVLPDRDLQFQVVGAFREGLTRTERNNKEDTLRAAAWTLVSRAKRRATLPKPGKYALLLRLDPEQLQGDDPQTARLRQALEDQARIRLMVKVTPSRPKALLVPLIVDLVSYYEDA